MVPLSGRVPPAGVHEDPAKTVTSEGSRESTRSYKKRKHQTQKTDLFARTVVGCKTSARILNGR